MASIAADRNLLFGLLALQNGLIDQVQLVAAFQAWTLDKARALADHLVGRGDLDADDRSAIDALVARHVIKHGGDVERSLAAVPAGRSTRESLAQLGDPDIGASIAQVGPGSTQRGAEDLDRTASYAVGSATSDGQRFRVLRPHARGGLGAVFVALDTELHREVALKQILDQHADDPTSRQRFLIEAEITGGLEHPGIVPVYGLGTYGDGRPYYAMRFIRGDSLKEAMGHFHADAALKTDPGRRSLELSKLLRRFLDVCNAIDYAHSRGVLHRDIKPANVIVGRHGETLVVDWGLAKPLGRSDPGSGDRTLVPSSASGSSETLPGSALGTPAYMSPEQAEGALDRLGPRSDVYSLGATLYCLLTGRPPYTGDDVGAILRAVQRGEFRPPRAIDPTIDPALEAVCLKAMALESEERYGSPRALAEEVEKWMADEPVSAWREPPARRALRWARRNRTAVASAAVALVAGVVGLAAVLAVQTQAKAALASSLVRETQAKLELATANTDLARSRDAMQARYDLAVAAIQTFHTGVSEDFLLKEEAFKDLRNRLLKSASDFYGKLGALLGKETDAASRRALWQANFEVAELTNKVGRKEDALGAHRSVLAARQALASEPGAEVGATVEVGRSLVAVAGLLEATGQTAEALPEYLKSEALLASLAGAGPSARAVLANCRSRMAGLLASTGKSAEALAAYRLARSEQEALAGGPAALKESRRDLADTIFRIATLLSETGESATAEAEYRTALAIQQKLADEDPAVSDFRSRLSDSHVNLGNLLLGTGKPGAAEAEYRTALTIRQKLADDHPAVTKFRSNLALSHDNLGWLLSQTGKPAAEGEYRTALAIYQKLADDHPTVTHFRDSLAASHQFLGRLLSETGKPRAAEAEHRTALAIQQKLTDENPAVTDFRGRLSDSHNSLGNLLSETGKPGAAEGEYRMALAIQQKLADDHPAVTYFRVRLAASHSNLGILLSQEGKPGAAEAEHRKALVLLRKLAEDNPTVTYYRDTAANADSNLSLVLRRLGRPAEARDHAERALRELLVNAHPDSLYYRAVLADSHLNRGLACRALGDPAGAATGIRQAAALIDSQTSPSGEFCFMSACAHAALAGLAGQAGSGVPAEERPSEAERAMALLHQAVAMGYSNVDAYRNEDALDPLRDRDDFRLLMMDLVMPAEPFTPDR